MCCDAQWLNDSSNAKDLHEEYSLIYTTREQQKTTLIKILFGIQTETTNLLAVTASFLIAEAPTCSKWAENITYLAVRIKLQNSKLQNNQ